MKNGISKRFGRRPCFCLASRLCLLLALALGVARSLPAAELVARPEVGLRVAAGFRITLFADSALANDIQAMTLDPEGNVVVSGPGYVRKLLDTDGDGRADNGVELVQTQTGATGLSYQDDRLLYVGDDGLWMIPDRALAPLALARPERFLSLRSGETGAHALAAGSGGWWYLLGGCGTGFGLPHVRLPTSPVRSPDGGALLRLSPDLRSSEVWADGFRNPVDFAVNAWGDLFTTDNDVDGDFLLPWHSPSRLWHIAHGGHHGWRAAGGEGGWSRPSYYLDAVEALDLLGRAVPSGILCYQHEQFPPRYQNGLFVLDWSFGRVYFVALEPTRASYQAEGEIFLEPLGRAGFTPTDACVAPDGSLLVSTGGRGTRGAVYRLTYLAEPGRPFWASNWMARSVSDTHAILQAPEPMAAWSRAIWEPAAAQLGPIPFDAVASDDRLPALLRVRAIEILTQLHGGLAAATAEATARASSPFVRARTAWSLGRVPSANGPSLLLALAQDPIPAVRRTALEAMLEQRDGLNAELVQAVLAANLPHPERRVRQAAARLAAALPEAAWKARWGQAQKLDPLSRATLTLALLWRAPSAEGQKEAVEIALGILRERKEPEYRLDALRLIMLALGDWRVREPSAEVFAPYELAGWGQHDRPTVEKARAALESWFPSGQTLVDLETARLLAMLEHESATLPGAVIGLITTNTPPEVDFHYLAVFARLKASAVTNFTSQVARTIGAMEKKMRGEPLRLRGHYSARLAELVKRLQERDKNLAESLLQRPDFALAGHAAVVASLGEQHSLAAARLFLQAAAKDVKFEWSAELVGLLGLLPPGEVSPLLRQQWARLELREELLLRLARKPEDVDRAKYLWGLSRLRGNVVQASLSALLKLSKDRSSATRAASLQLLLRLLEDPEARTLRAQVLALLTHETGQIFRAQEHDTAPLGLQRAYAHVLNWLARAEPNLAQQLRAANLEAWAKFNQRLEQAHWDQGDPRRGEALFRERRCLECHGQTTVFGPDLHGLGWRLSPHELFEEIGFPSRRIASGFRMIDFRTRDGQTYTGLVAAESAEGVIVRTALDATVRLADREIVSRELSRLSPMPAGLLDGLSAANLADLWAYFQTLR